ncbi:hypothetical protein SAY87_018915 [Trapa incisa]|uniref:SCP domain-containing protein n=1 Tax=Trapa incisa TaxID=236973 RepID=A0AAN7K1G4_9MYRT|nr:hypothetical protein SAY87_018915 [Trapa incisa]
MKLLKLYPFQYLLLLLLFHMFNASYAGGSDQQLYGVYYEEMQFLLAHNAVRQSKSEPPLSWDYGLERYARWWAGQRRHSCDLVHSFPEGQFQLGENIYWGGGSAWTPADAVRLWASEEKYYDYSRNSCQGGQMCGHYTQIVWRETSRVGCARVVCDNGDVFMTCNYYPPGNYVGVRPY